MHLRWEQKHKNEWAGRRGSVPPGKLMGPQPLPWGSSFTMKMLFLQSLQRPKWAASQVALSFSTRGLSTAQWSVTTAASMADIPTRITPDVIFTFVACSSNMLMRVFACVRGLMLPKAVRFVPDVRCSEVPELPYAFDVLSDLLLAALSLSALCLLVSEKGAR